MPYIIQNKRDVLDPAIDTVVDALRQLASDDEENNFEGNVNYVITRLLTQAYGKVNYRDINDVIGVLECAKLEFYRRAAAPYENQKSHDNGDVYGSPSAEDTMRLNRRCDSET